MELFGVKLLNITGESFLKLFNLSITAGWLIMAVMVVRLLLKKAPKWISCVLWAIVAVRLLFPVDIKSPFSLIPSAETIPVESIYSSDPSIADNRYYYQIQSGILTLDRELSPMMMNTNGSALRANISLFAVIWIIGMLLLLTYALASFLRLHSKVREAVPLYDNIRLCDAVKSPFILGFFRPLIYLPSDMDEERIEYVLAHEQTHIKRRDHWWKPLGYLLLTVYWFHPLVWAAYILLSRDIELACDEKVIKEMDMIGKKAYSETLVSCSMQRRMIITCPLAFGEVGVKERVKTILKYKKPAFWIIIAAVIACIAVAVGFLTNPDENTFNVKIVIPAGGEGPFYYSQDAISPLGGRVILSSGDGLGDTEVVLIPEDITEMPEDKTYGPTYMTPGMPVKMDVERGTWYRIGVAMSNPTDEDLIIYVRAKRVILRIADIAAPEPIGYDRIPMVMVGGKYYYDTGRESAKTDHSTIMDGEITSTVDGSEIPVENDQSNFGDGYGYQYGDDNTIEIYMNGKWIVFESRDSEEDAEDAPNTPEATPEIKILDAETAITAAILEGAASASDDYDYICCDFIPLETLSATPPEGATPHRITYYGWALCEKFKFTEEGIKEAGGSHLPIALTFDLDEDGYHLIEYWQPRDDDYESDIRDKFPAHIADDGIDSQKFILQQKQSCYKQAIQAGGLDNNIEGALSYNVAIRNLLDTICSDPQTSSNFQDYIDAHSLEYQELLYYGEFTVRYCFHRFEERNQTGLKGRIMAILCEELMQTEGRLKEDARTAETGQLWYDTLLAHGPNRMKPYLKDN